MVFWARLWVNSSWFYKTRFGHLCSFVSWQNLKRKERERRERLGQARREGEVGAKEEIKGLWGWISTLEVRI